MANILPMQMPASLRKRVALPVGALAVAGLLVAGCGSSSTTTSSSSAGSGASGGAGSSGGQSTQAQSAADVKSAATGDIPDNQQFLTFKGRAGGYSIRYPEGWTQQTKGADVTFRDKDNSIQVRISRGTSPTTASVMSQLNGMKASEPTLQLGSASTLSLPHGQAVKVSYSFQGAADPVTGKRPLLLIDRYVYTKGGKLATVDLASPKGVDNVDAYKMISRSFAWQ